MGVSGAGKTTVGTQLAAHLRFSFADADDFHSPANIAKMRQGVALDDGDRAGWLAAIEAQIDRWLEAKQPAVVACSALKRRYRDSLVAGRPLVQLIYLQADRALIAERLAKRTGHFMPKSLLDSQFDTLQEPVERERVITVSAAPPVDVIVEQLATAVGQRCVP
jgi:gluconokinase